MTGAPRRLPIGLWGFSQGAWAATLVAGDPDTAFRVAVSGSGVSPAEQMRYGTREQVRPRRPRAGGAGSPRRAARLR